MFYACIQRELTPTLLTPMPNIFSFTLYLLSSILVSLSTVHQSLYLSQLAFSGCFGMISTWFIQVLHPVSTLFLLFRSHRHTLWTQWSSDSLSSTTALTMTIFMSPLGFIRQCIVVNHSLCTRVLPQCLIHSYTLSLWVVRLCYTKE